MWTRKVRTERQHYHHRNACRNEARQLSATIVACVSPAPSSPASGATTPANVSEDLAFALRLADAADRVAMSYFDTPDLVVSVKADASQVTEADLSTERAIRELIGAERSTDGILGEEFGVSGDSSRQWVIDPIDGTANFLRGIPMWATLIALLIDGVPRVGVVSQPAIARRWWGASGLGAWTATANGPCRISVSRVDRLTKASVSFQSISQWDGAGQTNTLLRLSRAVGRDRGYGDAWPYMLLAEGRLEMVAEFDVKSYDIAAHVPIITEAGGQFTSFRGDTSLNDGSALASNGTLHSAFLDLLHPAPSTPEPRL